MTLQEIWEELRLKGYETDKFSVHSYLEIYEKLLEPYRDAAKNVLEIGLFKGDSMRLWERYFTQATIHGIDCDEQPHGGMADLRPMIAEKTHKIYIGDATSEADIEKYFKGMEFNVVWDDSSHFLSHQLQTFHLLKHKMEKGATYIIEDIQSLDTDRNLFENIDPHYNVEILDRRNVKGRYDDVLVIITGF